MLSCPLWDKEPILVAFGELLYGRKGLRMRGCNVGEEGCNMECNEGKEGVTKIVGERGWEVVNEAIAGEGDDGMGYYPLNYTEKCDDSDNNFFWQDYLGSLDYVRLAVKCAMSTRASNSRPTRLSWRHRHRMTTSCSSE